MKSFKRQLIYWYFAVLCLIVVGFSMAIYFGFRNISLSNLDRELLVLSKGVNADFYESSPDFSAFSSMYEGELSEYAVSPVYVLLYQSISPEKFRLTPLTHNTEQAGILDYTNIMRKSAPTPVFLSDTDISGHYKYRVCLFPLFNPRYGLVVVTPLTKIDHNSWVLLKLLFLLGGVFLTAAAVMGRVVVNTAFRPIRKIIDLTRNINTNNLSKKLPPVDSSDEIGDLNRTINEMIDRLEGSVSQIKRFSADVAHELKTPLTALRGEIELFLKQERSRAEYRLVMNHLLEHTLSL